MLNLRDLSLERKLKLITMLASGAALMLACVGIVTYELLTYRKALEREVTALADLVADNCSASLGFNRYHKEVTNSLSTIAAYRNITGASVSDSSGTEYARYVRADQAGEPFVPLVEPPARPFFDDHLHVVRNILAGGDIVGTIYVKSDLEGMKARLRHYATSVLLLMVAALGVAYVLSSRLQKVISGPLLRLSQTARAVSNEKNYSVRAPKSGNDELGQLIEGFNEMLGQIQQRDDALRQAHDQLERRVEERTRELQQEVLERKQAEHIIQQQFGRISLLNQITHAISERQDVQSILSIVLQQLEERLNVACGAFYLFDNARNSLLLTAFRSRTNPEQCPFALELGPQEVQQANLQLSRGGNTVYLTNASDTPVPFFTRPSMGSLVLVPLIVDSKPFGVLITGRPQTAAFSSGECEFLKMLSEQVALAGYHAQLYTQLQSAYNELRHTQQAVMQHERLRALGQLASGIAHDINNALSPITGFAELLLNSEQNLSATGTRYLKHIRTSSEDIAHIVSRLREFYRQREDTHELKPVQLNDLAGQVVDLTRPRWRDMSQENGISISVKTDLGPLLPRISGIESELREAMTNLILNAVDAMPGGGTITVRTRIGGGMPGGTDKRPSEVVLEVIDTGIGMDEETRKRCLEPFFSTKGVRGTGLGLAMVYGIMERHEGRIEIDSVQGQGTTMRMVFPVRERSESKESNVRQAPIALPRLRILFVDDEPLLRQLVHDMLQHEGHHVTVADGGQSGLTAFHEALKQQQPFDAVITDLGMPNLDGRKLSQLLKQASPQTPVIMLTGWGTLMRSESEMPMHVDCVLSKPPRISELRQALRKTLFPDAAGVTT